MIGVPFGSSARQIMIALKPFCPVRDTAILMLSGSHETDTWFAIVAGMKSGFSVSSVGRSTRDSGSRIDDSLAIALVWFFSHHLDCPVPASEPSTIWRATIATPFGAQ